MFLFVLSITSVSLSVLLLLLLLLSLLLVLELLLLSVPSYERGENNSLSCSLKDGDDVVPRGELIGILLILLLFSYTCE